MDAAGHRKGAISVDGSVSELEGALAPLQFMKSMIERDRNEVLIWEIEKIGRISEGLAPQKKGLLGVLFGAMDLLLFHDRLGLQFLLLGVHQVTLKERCHQNDQQDDRPTDHEGEIHTISE
jgi:hypothetical protein